jgi:hypothetical protein
MRSRFCVRQMAASSLELKIGPEIVHSSSRAGAHQRRTAFWYRY